MMRRPGPPRDELAPRDPALRRRLRLAFLALFWERLVPLLWPALAVIGVFLALALLDLPALLPGWLHLALLVLFAVLLAVALADGLRRFRLPGREAERRRLETASALAHRPLTALADRLSAGANDPATAALWHIHRERMAAATRRLKVGVPAAGLVARDPMALRVALSLVLLLAALDAGEDWGPRLARALTPQLAPSVAAATVSLDIWVTPPEYTGLAPQFLQRGTAAEPIAVPTGSTVLAQVQGGRGVPRLIIDGAPGSGANGGGDFTRIDQHSFKGGATLAAGSRLAVEQDGSTLGSWPITIVPDLPPNVVFAKPPQATEHAALRIEYQASDDYGVEGVKALIRRPGDRTNTTIALELPLPGLHLKDARNASFHDLSAHPWAGLPVEIRLQARDALGQTGESDPVTMTLPERVFHHPVARAIIDQRKQLTTDPTQGDVVAETLSDLSLQPRFFGDDLVVFLALRDAWARLNLDKSADGIAAVQQLLWETALRIEDGNASLAQRDLRQAMQALKDALARNAPDQEIERLTRELQQAIDRYLQALAQNMQRQNPGDQQPIDPSRLLSRQDLQKMLDRARDLARTGARDQAQDLLSRLQEMLENLQAARPGQLQNGPGQQSMRAMQELMRRQQQLLDRSFRQSRRGEQGQPGQPGQDQQGQAQPGDSQQDAAQQDALRHALGELMRRLGEQGGDIPQSLGRAERAMRGAVDSLNQDDPSQAMGQQSEALDQLQQAMRSMQQQMMGGNGLDGQPNERAPGQADRDPFGRIAPDHNDNGYGTDEGSLRMGNSRDTYALEKAKEILDELRRRAGERSRPELELDYIDRLLKRF